MNKKQLYESIMSSVAREVKKVLNESDSSKDEIIEKIAKKCFTKKGSVNIGTHKIIHPIGIYKNELIGPRLFPVLDEKNDIALDDFLVEISNKNGNWHYVYASRIDEEDLLNILSILNAKNINVNMTDDLEEFDDEDGYEDEEEYEMITYNDIIDAVEGEDYQDIIDDEGNGIGNWILDRIQYPENGANVFNACVEIAERLLNGESADDLREELGEDEI